MIGKIMSEAAHSIIGMFSAKPLGMEHNTSNSDFGSLLRSPEEQPHSSSAGKDIDTPDFEDAGFEETSPAAIQPWETTKVLPFLNQSFGSKIFGQDRSSQKIEQDQTTFNQDGMINPDTLQRSGSTAFSADEKAHQAAAGVTSDILSRQANITLGNGSQIGMASTKGVPDMVDGRPGNDKPRPGQMEEFQFRSQIRENAVGDEIFPSSDKGLLKLQSLQSQSPTESDERVAPAAKTARSDGFEKPDVQLNNQTSKLEAGKQAATLSAPVTMGEEQNGARSGPGKFDFRSSPQVPLPVAPTDLSKPAIADGGLLEAGKQAAALSGPVTMGEEQKGARSGLGKFDFRSSPQDPLPVVSTDLSKSAKADGGLVESVKFELQPKAKTLETLIEQQPLANSSAQLAARETMQKPVSFDMSSPQVAERLAAEIADISVNGGPKKFEINPRNLGRMEITFTTRGSTEIIEIQTEHRGAKDIIVQHGQLLQDILKSQGRDDLTFRVDVKENIFSSSRTDDGNLAQQENRDAREQQSRPSQRRQMGSSFDSATENDAASDSSRYA